MSARRKKTSPATRVATGRPRWTPFQRAQQLTVLGETGQMYQNSLYTVIITPKGSIIHLSIRRNDREAVHDWRDLQRIKNELIGPEHEGFELYPAESRLIDTANQFHLFVFADPAFRLPVGWNERLVADSAGDPAKTKARQRPFREDERPADALTGEQMERLSAGYVVTDTLAGKK